MEEKFWDEIEAVVVWGELGVGGVKEFGEKGKVEVNLRVGNFDFGDIAGIKWRPLVAS